MSFQTPRSIEEMLTAIHKREYLMPAIQREFVWDVGQITKLVDSLMRGYPVGSFLLWDVKPDTAKSYTFYEFLTNYHERDNPYADKATVPAGNGTTAVLDGQQRLTSLNIALYGSIAEKKKYAGGTAPTRSPSSGFTSTSLTTPTKRNSGSSTTFASSPTRKPPPKRAARTSGSASARSSASMTPGQPSWTRSQTEEYWTTGRRPAACTTSTVQCVT